MSQALGPCARLHLSPPQPGRPPREQDVSVDGRQGGVQAGDEQDQEPDVLVELVVYRGVESTFGGGLFVEPPLDLIRR